jgi:hypothetical protein
MKTGYCEEMEKKHKLRVVKASSGVSGKRERSYVRKNLLRLTKVIEKTHFHFHLALTECHGFLFLLNYSQKIKGHTYICSTFLNCFERALKNAAYGVISYWDAPHMSQHNHNDFADIASRWPWIWPWPKQQVFIKNDEVLMSTAGIANLFGKMWIAQEQCIPIVNNFHWNGSSSG